MKLALHLESMNKEERILQLIKDVDERPYTLSIRNVVTKYHIMPETILMLIEKLNLEIIGHKWKNDRREIQTFLTNNPKTTAENAIKKLGFSEHLIYGAARDMGFRFETKHTIRLKYISMYKSKQHET